jgi:hypothetical protein
VKEHVEPEKRRAALVLRPSEPGMALEKEHVEPEKRRAALVLRPSEPGMALEDEAATGTPAVMQIPIPGSALARCAR